jgi:hypothetical protein
MLEETVGGLVHDRNQVNAVDHCCRCQYFIDTISGFVYNFCMMPVMVKEADLNRIEVPEDYEVLDATALGRRSRCKRDTEGAAYLDSGPYEVVGQPQPDGETVLNCKVHQHPPPRLIVGKP